MKISNAFNQNWGQRRRISLPVRGAGYKLLIPFRGYSAELKKRTQLAKRATQRDFPLSTTPCDFEAASFTTTAEYIPEIEGTGEDVWRVRRGRIPRPRTL